MTTPDEFLQFAKEMGLGQIQSSNTPPPSPSSTTSNKTESATGLLVLNNLCRLIEQIHQLKLENDRLRAQVALNDRFDLYDHHSSTKSPSEIRRTKQKSLFSSSSVVDEEKGVTLSPTNSIKLKYPYKHRTQKGFFFYKTKFFHV